MLARGGGGDRWAAHTGRPERWRDERARAQRSGRRRQQQQAGRQGLVGKSSQQVRRRRQPQCPCPAKDWSTMGREGWGARGWVGGAWGKERRGAAGKGRRRWQSVERGRGDEGVQEGRSTVGRYVQLGTRGGARREDLPMGDGGWMKARVGASETAIETAGDGGNSGKDLHAGVHRNGNGDTGSGGVGGGVGRGQAKRGSTGVGRRRTDNRPKAREELQVREGGGGV